MAEFLFKTEEEIIDDIRQMLEDSGTPVTDWEVGSANRTFWEVVAKLAAGDQYMLERLLHVFFIDDDELTGTDLEKRAYERKITRKIGTISSGSVILSRSTPAPFDILVPQGTTFGTLQKDVIVETVDDVIMLTGESQVVVNVQSTEIGANGNLVAKTQLTQIGVAIIGVETIVVNNLGLSGGTDTETDDELRARLLDAIQHTENGGSVRDYIRWAKEVPGVVSASCIELARGPGTTDVIILGAGGEPSSDLIQAVKDHIEVLRPSCADVLVRGPETLIFDIELTYWTDSVSPLEDTIRAALQSYVATVGVGGVIRVSQIYNVIMDIKEIKDMTLILPIENIVLNQNQMGVLGDVNLTRGE